MKGPLPLPTELGHPVPLSFVIGSTDRASVGVTGFLSFSNGFKFDVVIVVRDADPKLNPLRVFNIDEYSRSHLSSPETGFTFSLEFADASVSESNYTFDLSQPYTSSAAARSLILLGASGGGGRWTQSWFAAPLPAAGALSFKCKWPHIQLGGNYVVSSTKEILKAASASKQLLP